MIARLQAEHHSHSYILRTSLRPIRTEHPELSNNQFKSEFDSVSWLLLKCWQWLFSKQSDRVITHSLLPKLQQVLSHMIPAGAPLPSYCCSAFGIRGATLSWRALHYRASMSVMSVFRSLSTPGTSAELDIISPTCCKLSPEPYSYVIASFLSLSIPPFGCFRMSRLTTRTVRNQVQAARECGHRKRSRH